LLNIGFFIPQNRLFDITCLLHPIIIFASNFDLLGQCFKLLFYFCYLAVLLFFFDLDIRLKLPCIAFCFQSQLLCLVVTRFEFIDEFFLGDKQVFLPFLLLTINLTFLYSFENLLQEAEVTDSVLVDSFFRALIADRFPT
jgi:hypothetical protein